MLITWCDIVPCEILPPKAFERTTVFLHGNECRYTVTRDGVLRQLKEGTGGGVIGMWMVRNFRGIRHFKEGQDIADVFVENFGAFGTHEIRSFVDIGDRAEVTWSFWVGDGIWYRIIYTTGVSLRKMPISATFSSCFPTQSMHTKICSQNFRQMYTFGLGK
jgi:hypothetical protein